MIYRSDKIVRIHYFQDMKLLRNLSCDVRAEVTASYMVSYG